MVGMAAGSAIAPGASRFGYRRYGGGGWWWHGVNIYVGIYVGPGYGRRCYSPRYSWHPCYDGYRWRY